jgi:hypothetical protein
MPITHIRKVRTGVPLVADSLPASFGSSAEKDLIDLSEPFANGPARPGSLREKSDDIWPELERPKIDIEELDGRRSGEDDMELIDLGAASQAGMEPMAEDGKFRASSWKRRVRVF